MNVRPSIDDAPKKPDDCGRHRKPQNERLRSCLGHRWMLRHCALTTELSGRPRCPCRGQTRPTIFHGPLERVVSQHDGRCSPAPEAVTATETPHRHNQHDEENYEEGGKELLTVAKRRSIRG